MGFRRIHAVGGLGTIALLYAFDPKRAAFFPSCPFRLITGWSCPGCGTLRALHALFHGHVGAALHDNALSVFVLLALAAAGAFDRLRVPPAGGAVAKMTSPAAAACLLIVAVLFGVIRNIPVRPFVWLIP